MKACGDKKLFPRLSTDLIVLGVYTPDRVHPCGIKGRDNIKTLWRTISFSSLAVTPAFAKQPERVSWFCVVIVELLGFLGPRLRSLDSLARRVSLFRQDPNPWVEALQTFDKFFYICAHMCRSVGGCRVCPGPSTLSRGSSDPGSRGTLRPRL